MSRSRSTLTSRADDYLWPIAGNLYNSLLLLDNDYNVILDLATGYEVAEDGLSITVTLNPLATWHDGTPVTAADVKYTLEQIVADPARLRGRADQRARIGRCRR